MAEQLELHDEFTTDQATSGARALEIAKSEHYDLVLLDIGLPDLGGREVCRMLRKAGLSVPIIMLTGADTDSDTILGLDAGARLHYQAFQVECHMARPSFVRHDQSEDAVFQLAPYTVVSSSELKMLRTPKPNKKSG